MKIALVLPAEGSQNLGNTMICESTERLLRRVSFIGEVARFSFLRRPSREELERLNQCDLAIFVGTNIFQPCAPGWKWHPEDWRQVHIPYWFYGVGYSGPLKEDPQEICPPMVELISWAAGAEGLGVRDPQTVRWLSRFHIDSELIGCPVLAYADSFSKITLGEGRPVLAVREILLHNPGEEAQAAQRAMIDWFFEKYPNGVAIVQEPADLKLLEGRPILTQLEDIIEALAQARFVLTARLHAGMIALSLGRPAVFLAHDTRVASFCEMIGLPMRELSFAGLAGSIKAIQAIERGDLDEFQESVPRILCFRQRLEEFLKASLQISPRGRERLLSTLIRLQAHMQQLQAGRAQLQARIQAQDQELTRLREQLQAKDHALNELQAQLQAKDRELSELRQTVTQIYSSLGWMMLQRVRGFIDWALPPGTRRRSLLVRTLRAINLATGEDCQAVRRADTDSVDLAMKHPSVLFFIPTMEVGGAERVCLQYINHLQSFESCLLLQVRNGPLLNKLKVTVPVFEIFEYDSALSKPLQQQGLLERLSSYAARLHHWVLSGLRKIEPLYYCYSLLWQAHKIAKLARQHGCSTCVSFITLANIIAILAKVFFYRQLKVVINVHDVTSQILEHSNLKPYERFLLKWLVRLFYPRADTIVAVAQGIKRDLIESFGLPAQKIVVIYNPIDVQGICLRAAEPVAHPWFTDRSEPLIIAVGRLVKLKGFDLLIRSAAQLSVPARLAIIGDGEERAALESLVIELGLTDRVVLLGFQENPWKYMARADLFVLSSLTEGMPNVIGEAIALGLPVVATDCSPGVREYLDDGQAGLLVPPGDPRALARGIEQLLLDAPLRQKLARRGRERIAQFDLSAAVRAYEGLLFSLVRGGLDKGGVV